MTAANLLSYEMEISKIQQWTVFSIFSIVNGEIISFIRLCYEREMVPMQSDMHPTMH